MLEPLATPDRLDLEPAHVIAIVCVAVVITLLAAALRVLLVATADETGDLSRELGEQVARKALDRRTMPAPWFCDRCRSANTAAAAHCYSCGARRVEAEAPVPDADVPAGASAGRTHRDRARH
ncbi:MAG TPA: hypothetical protein VFY23_07490 [Candidatus Limnocylindrales bacterium]|nr:hypothetical protein [Candidatus Limnocylindrales bacterium]